MVRNHKRLPLPTAAGICGCFQTAPEAGGGQRDAYWLPAI